MSVPLLACLASKDCMCTQIQAQSSGGDALSRALSEAEEEMRRLRAAHAEELSRQRSEALAAEAASRRALSAAEEQLMMVRRPSAFCSRDSAEKYLITANVPIVQVKLEWEAKQRIWEASGGSGGGDSIDSARFARAQRDWEEAGKRVQANHDAALARLRAELAASEEQVRIDRVALHSCLGPWC